MGKATICENPSLQRVDCGGEGHTIRGIDMATEHELPDLKRLEAQLLAERQAYYDRVAAKRSDIHEALQELSEDQGLHTFLQDRLERLLGTPPPR